MAEGKERFQIGAFLENPVPLHMWERLDLSPQSKAQLARAIVSSWSTTRGSAGSPLVVTAAVVAKFRTGPAVKCIAHEDKEGYDQLLLKRGTCKVLDRGLEAKTIWGHSIPKILPLINCRLVRLRLLQDIDKMFTGFEYVNHLILHDIYRIFAGYLQDVYRMFTRCLHVIYRLIIEHRHEFYPVLYVFSYIL